MKLEKAIEINKELPDNLHGVLDYEQQGAIQLGIEALKAVQEAREKLPGVFSQLLPGETEE